MIVVIDVNALIIAVFDRIQVSSISQPIRDILLAANNTVPAADRIVHASTLDENVPVTPFLAFRRGPIPTVEQSIAAAHFYWFLYDQPKNTYFDINSMIKHFSVAYNLQVNPLAFNGGHLHYADLLIGEERPDRNLGGLSMTQLTLTIYC